MRIKKIALIAFLAALIAAGCSGEDATGEPAGEVTREPGEEITGEPGEEATAQPGEEVTGKPGEAVIEPPLSELEAWIEESRQLFLGQAYQRGDLFYILVTYGEKPSGGYDVKITSVEVGDDAIIVRALFTEPQEGDMVTEALTYPYDLATIEAADLPVIFEAEGAEFYLPTLYGLDRLLPIKAGSDWIKVFSPEPGQAVEHGFTVSGIANVFEGTVNYRVIATDGTILDEGFTTGMMGDWGFFTFSPALAGYKGKFALELYTISVKDGSEEDMVQVELNLN